MNTNKITFWGVRGSHPTPEKSKMKFGGETSCVEIRTAQNELIILDMGTGIRNLGKKLLQENSTFTNCNIFLSHTHWDHIQGIMSCNQFYSESCQFTIHYGKTKAPSLQKLFERILDFQLWPISLNMLENITFLNHKEKQYKISENIRVNTNLHDHPNGAFGYRFDIGNVSIAYVTDCEHHPGEPNQNVVDFVKNADLLIHDAHFTPKDLQNSQGWGHSSWKEAVMVAKQANVKQLALFHYSPDYDDATIEQIGKDAKKEFPNTILSKVGLTIEI
ncbi:MAG: MBL fold metallo-hydrolase [Candidatus Marinimicrobia bacterium]|nr:MBL fold metallo-hydrolase [Candidatus Neomarinimicrobiota bacterium]MBL7109761.1 MBL fold metallo-hydrolase [Candidatus Neomarinimicrobiota bacterium]